MKYSELWKHQQETVKLLTDSPRFFDTSDPGVGKTLSALYAFHKRRKKNGGAALIVAPKSLLEPAWGEEIRKFFPKMTYSVSYAENRLESFKPSVDAYIINTDGVKWFAEQGARFIKKLKLDTLIIDESSCYKHRTSQRSKAIKGLKRFFEYRQLMTGTPTSNSILDIWHQLFILDDGIRLGRVFHKFRDQVCTPIVNGAGFIEWKDNLNAETDVASLIADISIHHKFEECMDIPNNFSYSVPFVMNNKHRKAYETLKAECVLQLQNKEITAVHAAALRTKLLQTASGAVYFEHGKYEILDNKRNELILDLVNERDHSVVFYNWKHQKDRLIAEAEKRKITHSVIDSTISISRRNEIVANYQRGKYKTLFLHPATGAHGLTLTKGTATIWASPPDRPDFLKQGMARVYRGSQTKKTYNIMIEAKHTVEQKVFASLKNKTHKMNNFLEILI